MGVLLGSDEGTPRIPDLNFIRQSCLEGLLETLTFENPCIERPELLAARFFLAGLLYGRQRTAR